MFQNDSSCVGHLSLLRTLRGPCSLAKQTGNSVHSWHCCSEHGELRKWFRRVVAFRRAPARLTSGAAAGSNTHRPSSSKHQPELFFSLLLQPALDISQQRKHLRFHNIILPLHHRQEWLAFFSRRKGDFFTHCISSYTFTFGHVLQGIKLTAT